MRKYLLIGALAFVAIAVGFAPASILDRAVDGVEGLDLTGARGTLWNGTATVSAGGNVLGEAQWRFVPTSLLTLSPAFDLTLTDGDVADATRRQAATELRGRVSTSLNGEVVSLHGLINPASVRPWLAAYDIELGGNFMIEDMQLSGDLRGNPPVITAASGYLRWEGGPVDYTLSGRRERTTLPPLVGSLDTTPTGIRATVIPEGGQTPVMVAQTTQNGFVKVGITRLFTQMLGNPWPGSDADHEVVLEVEEQVF